MDSEASPAPRGVPANPEIPIRIRAAAPGIATAAVSAPLGPEAAGIEVETPHAHSVPVSADCVSRAVMPLGFTACLDRRRSDCAKCSASSGSKSKNKGFYNVSPLWHSHHIDAASASP